MFFTWPCITRQRRTVTKQSFLQYTRYGCSYKMFDFYKKQWFPYICPFFIYFATTQIITFLPQWEVHLFAAQAILCGLLLWIWRHNYHIEAINEITVKQIAICACFGILELSTWWVLAHFNFITITQQTCPSSTIPITDIIVKGICYGGFIVIIPIVSEIFWRSFMLRYLIDQNFQSIKLGSFQFFSFAMIIVLAAFTSNYIAAFALIALMQNILMVWQKNLLCCILTLAVVNGLLLITLFSGCGLPL